MSAESISVVHQLLSHAIDYAGLFPPAGLDMTQAVANYAGYARGTDAWALGRFVVPVARLDQFESEAGNYFSENIGGPVWRLNALAGDDVGRDCARISEFNREHQSSIRVEAVELKAGSMQEIVSAAGNIPNIREVYFEIPIHSDPRDLIGAIARVGARAKVRTGGITSDAFPASEDLARFIETCVKENVVFKATAGLHHAVRSRYPLNYEHNSPVGMMYGFLNVTLASAFILRGMTQKKTIEVLEESSAQAFHFDNDGVTWRGNSASLADLIAMRRRVAASFGSCSFREPIDELRQLHLL
jgi:hypothetical protein